MTQLRNHTDGSPHSFRRFFRYRQANASPFEFLFRIDPSEDLENLPLMFGGNSNPIILKRNPDHLSLTAGMDINNRL